MKKSLFAIIIVAALAACNTTDQKVSGGNSDSALSASDKEKAASDTSNYTTIQWVDSTSLQLGKVQKGEVVEVVFKFKNSGDKPLVITDVTAGCGCTVPEKPERPYAPTETGEIKAKFDSKNQQTGVPHTKYVTVVANTKPTTTHQLSFTVEITE